jgi:hypothetical protein
VRVSDPTISIGSGEPSLAQLMPAPVVQPTKRPGWVIPLIATFAVLLLGAGVAIVFLLFRGPSGSSPVAARTSKPPAAPVVVEAQPPARVWPTPVMADLVLSVKIMKKTCFGSAGCNVTYNIEVNYTGSLLEPGKVWDVTYEVKGGDDPQINTFELTGTSDGYNYSIEREKLIQVPKSSSQLTATATALSVH